MIPFESIINGEKVKRELPTRYEEVQFKYFLLIANSPKDTNSILSILTGIDVEIIKKAKIKNVDDIILALSFFNHDSELKLPETILGYNVPNDLGFECTAQYEDLKLHINECRKKKLTDLELLSFYPLYCAIYACSQKYDSYDWQKAEYLANEFMSAPATEVLAIGNFTLVKLIGLSLGIKSDVHKRLTRRQSWMLAFRALGGSLALRV